MVSFDDRVTLGLAALKVAARPDMPTALAVRARREAIRELRLAWRMAAAQIERVAAMRTYRDINGILRWADSGLDVVTRRDGYGRFEPTRSAYQPGAWTGD